MSAENMVDKIAEQKYSLAAPLREPIGTFWSIGDSGPSVLNLFGVILFVYYKYGGGVVCVDASSANQCIIIPNAFWWISKEYYPLQSWYTQMIHIKGGSLSILLSMVRCEVNTLLSGMSCY